MSAAPRAHPVRGILLMIVAVTILALLDTTAKYLSSTYPVLGVVWARFAFQTLLMLVVLGPRSRLGLLRTSRPKVQIFRGIVLMGASLFFVSALARMPIADASAIGFLAPLIITALSVPMLRERVDALSWLAVMCGFAGVLVIIRPGGEMFSWAALLPLGAAACFALFQVLTRKLAGVDPTLPTLFYPALVGTTIMAFVLPFYWSTPQTPMHAGLFVLMGFLAGVGHFIMIKAYQFAPAPVVAPFVYSQLVVVIGLGYAVFDELPDRWSVLGMAIIVASGAFIFKRQHGAHRHAPK
ncbi:MAG: DMT family transporter [Betaproteobacteria bacterium]|nr:DMT family transporter [Betaproteobacteria bacterium]